MLSFMKPHKAPKTKVGQTHYIFGDFEKPEGI